jgi:hypothetical protein
MFPVRRERAWGPPVSDRLLTIKRFLGNLSQGTFRLAELRNLYGTGHGKEATTKVPSPRRARLAIGSATTLGTFLYETHQETLKK